MPNIYKNLSPSINFQLIFGIIHGTDSGKIGSRNTYLKEEYVGTQSFNRNCWKSLLFCSANVVFQSKQNTEINDEFHAQTLH